MKILKFNLPRDFNLFLMGDDHIGAIARHEAGWNRMVDMILSEPNNYAVHHGDCVEAILVDDHRYQESTTKESQVLAQIHEAHRLYEPIAKRLLVILDGNHPAKLHRIGDVTLEICKRLWGDTIAEKRYGTFTCKIHYCDYEGNLMFKHLATHGRRPINSSAEPEERAKLNMKIALTRHLRDIAGDCLVMSKGHTHKLLCKRPLKKLFLCDDGYELQNYYTKQNMEYVIDDGDKFHVLSDTDDPRYIYPASRWFVNTGSFLKTYVMGASTYSERFEYPPTELGFYILKVRNGLPCEAEKVTV